MHHIAHAAAAAEVQGGRTTITVVLSILISKRNQCHVQRTGLHNATTLLGLGVVQTYLRIVMNESSTHT